MRRVVAVLAILAVVVLAALSPPGRQVLAAVTSRVRGLDDPGLAAAVVPDATFLAMADGRAVRGSAIGQRLLGVAEQSLAEQGSDVADVRQQVRDAAGLTEDDVDQVVVSANLQGLDPASEPDLTRLDGLLAVKLKRALTGDELRAAIADLTRQTGNVLTPIESEQDGVALHRLYVSDGGPSFSGPGDPDVPSFAVALLPGGRVLYLGFRQSVESAVDRFRQGRPAGLPSELQEAREGLLRGAQSWAVARTPEALRRDWAWEADAAPGEPDYPDLATALMNLRGLALAQRCGDTLEVQATAGFGTAEQAQAAAEFARRLYAQVHGAVASEPSLAALPLWQTVRIEVVETRVELHAELTETDVAQLESAGALR